MDYYNNKLSNLRWINAKDNCNNPNTKEKILSNQSKKKICLT